MLRTVLSRLGVVLLLTFGLGLVAPAAAQTPDASPKMTVTPYLGGCVKYGEWLPLHVALSNDSGDLSAEIQAEITGPSGEAVYAAPVSLPAGARKEVDLYVLPSTSTQAITVRLVQGGRTLAKADTDVSLYLQNDYLIGAVAPTADALALLSGLTLPSRSQTRLVPFTLDDLPERAEPLRSLDCLILTGVDTAPLTPAQGEALRAWVELGGRLVIGGGAGARRALAGLPEQLQPADLGETVELTALDGLAAFANTPVRVPGPFLATLPADHRGRPAISQDGQPLLIKKPLGAGWIGYLALDPAASPFDAWAGTLAFWQRLLEPGSALPTDAPHDIPGRVLESEQMAQPLSSLPALDLPSIRTLGLLLGLYVLLVGPVNYLLLRRLRRLAWGWITIPTLTLAFSVGGYALGHSLRGSDVILNQISILSLSPQGGRLPVRSYVGLFSPTSRDYDIQVGGDALVSSLSYRPTGYVYDGLDVLQSEPALVRHMSVGQWAMQGFRTETWLEASGLAIDAALSIEGDRVRGTIRNDVGRPLQDAILIVGHRYAQLGDLANGEPKEIEAALQGAGAGYSFPWELLDQVARSPAPPNLDSTWANSSAFYPAATVSSSSAHPDPSSTGPSREGRLRQSILQAYFHTDWELVAPPAGLTLLAWTDLDLLDVQVTGTKAARRQTTLVVARLPLSAADGAGGWVDLPPGLIPGRVVETEGAAWECGSPSEIYIEQGSAVLEYQLPPELHGLDTRTLAVRVAVSYSGSPLPFLSLFDWTTGEWVALQDVERDTQHPLADRECYRYPAPDPARFADPASGLIRLRVYRESYGDCSQFDLELAGVMEQRNIAEETAHD